jgi:Xylose isomerase-like TIM barrel
VRSFEDTGQWAPQSRHPLGDYEPDPHTAPASGSYARYGYPFTATDKGGIARALDDNCRAVDEACELDTLCLVLVVGSLSGALDGQACHRDIALARSQVTEGIARLLEYAQPRKIALAIEPLHSMYTADRACVNTLEQALDICGAIDPAGSGDLGVAVDVYQCGGIRSLRSRFAVRGSVCWPSMSAIGLHSPPTFCWIAE